MLRIAVQSKGRLFDDTMNLLSEADIKVSASKRTLLVQSPNFPLEVLYLRDDDIPQSVASGVADIGVVGENEFVERGEDAEVISRLGFSKCRLSLAIPKEIDYQGVRWFHGKKIATSYPDILRRSWTRMASAPRYTSSRVPWRSARASDWPTASSTSSAAARRW